MDLEVRERTKNIRQTCEEIIKWGKLVLKYNGKDIDGALIGGASLKVDSFIEIIDATK